MRFSVSILTMLMLALTFAHTPFRHVHEHEENNHHPHASFFHAHFHHAHAAGSKSAIRSIDPDDDAVYQSWYADISHDPFVPAFLPVSIYDFTVSESSEPYVDRVILSGHDPPPRVRTSPRAPPV